jgi:hypothetical protein
VETSGHFMKLYTIMVVQEDCFSSWTVLEFEAVFGPETLIPLYLAM